MNIVSVYIKNFRGIGHLEMELREGMNLVIGNNGAGKSSFLRALSSILSSVLQGIGIGGATIETEDVRTTTVLVGDTVVQTNPVFPVEVKAQIEIENQVFECYISKDSIGSGENYHTFEAPAYFQTLYESKEKKPLPLICSLNADSRQWKKEYSDTVMLPNRKVERIKGYQGALRDRSDFREVQNWCLQMDFAAYQKKQPIREYEVFKLLVNSFMRYMDGQAKDPKVYYSSDAGTVVYWNGMEEKPIYRLSDGYQNVLCMVMELAYRAAVLNPELENIQENLRGIVLIDEIDIHLHPAWQWKILEALHSTFPRVQFIIATHSPIILSSAKDASLFLLKSPNEAVSLESVYGYSVDDVLTLSQASKDIPEEIKWFYDQAEMIFDHGTGDQLAALLEKAEKDLKDSPEVLKSFLDFVEVNRWIEEA